MALSCLQVFVAAILLLVVVRRIVKVIVKMCQCKTCLIGKTVIVTGGDSGIGYETARNLASRGCRLILAGVEDSTEARDTIIAETNNRNVLSKHVDLSSLKSVRVFAADILATEPRLDILINNAGVTAYSHMKTDDGLNREMQINYFGPFLLTHLLADLLKRSAPSRVIFVSSSACYFSDLTVDNLNSLYIPQDMLRPRGYINSKLALVTLSAVLTDQLCLSGVTSNCLHPGLAQTRIFLKKWGFFPEKVGYMWYYLAGLFGKNALEAAQTSIHLAVAPNLDKTSGKFFMNCKESFMPFKARDKEYCYKIYNATVKLVHLQPEEML